MKHRNVGEGSALTPVARIALLVGLLALLAGCRAETQACVADTCDAGSDIDSIDADADGWPATDDCDDEDALAYPGATEVAYDGIDQNCDGEDFVDVDGDGFSHTDDCNDDDASVHPGATEVPYDGIDQDCDGDDLRDVDGDGWVMEEDCDDADAEVHPDASEVFGNGHDDDCDGTVDEIFVCAAGGDFATIQEGVDAAPEGGLVEICPGTYYEAVVLPGGDLTLRGAGATPEEVLVDASGGGSVVLGELRAGSEFVLENLAMTGSEDAALDLVSEGSLRVVDVEISGLLMGTAVRVSSSAISVDGLSVRDCSNESDASWPMVNLAAVDGTIDVVAAEIKNINTAASHTVCAFSAYGASVSVTNSFVTESDIGNCAFILGYHNYEVSRLTFSNNSAVGNSYSYEDGSATVLTFVGNVGAGRVDFQNNILDDPGADRALHVEWDWCNLDVPSGLTDAFHYNLITDIAAEQIYNPPNNAESDCSYYEYTSGCTCRAYGSDAVERLFWASDDNYTFDPGFSDSDLHLSPDSAARDAGNPDSEFNDTDGSRNDLGAYGGPRARG